MYIKHRRKSNNKLKRIINQRVRNKKNESDTNVTYQKPTILGVPLYSSYTFLPSLDSIVSEFKRRTEQQLIDSTIRRFWAEVTDILPQ